MKKNSNFAAKIDKMQGSVTTIGCFDGVHRGHRFLISQMRDIASVRRLITTVAALDIPGRRLLTPDFEKTEMLRDAGVGICKTLHFTEELRTTSAFDFMKYTLKEELNTKVLVVGYDNMFGHNRENTFDDYVDFGRELGMDVVRAESLKVDGKEISSTLIRQLIAEGRTEHAAYLLGYPYTIRGTVVKGRHIGTSLGFPTANIGHVNPAKLLPPSGVYSAKVGGRKAILNIGTNPTVSDDGSLSLEVHIIDFSDDIYGEEISVEIGKKIRDERHFSSLEALQQQIAIDVKMV